MLTFEKIFLLLLLIFILMEMFLLSRSGNVFILAKIY